MATSYRLSFCSKILTFHHTIFQGAERESRGGKMDKYKPQSNNIHKVVEKVRVWNTVNCCVYGKEEEEERGEMSKSMIKIGHISWGPFKSEPTLGIWTTYRVVFRGIIAPFVKVWTSKINGIMDKTLWCDENGVNQWTARLWAQTIRTGTFIGRTQSIRTRMEWE